MENSKQYIGATTLENPKHRWRKHKYCAKYGRNGYLYNAIRKYDENAFSFEIIAKAETEKNLNLYEKGLIGLFQTHYTDGGYNIEWGGNNSKNSAISRAKMSKAQYDLGIACPVDQYDLSGNFINSYKSIHHAASETGCSISHIGGACKGDSLTVKGSVFRYKDEPFNKYPVEREYTTKPVEVYNKNGELIDSYGSITECAESLGTNIANVSAGCRGYCYTVDGRVVRFQGDDFDKYPIRGKTSAKSVIQIDAKTDKELRKFDSITRAYKYLGKESNQGISLVCQGRQNTCHGYKWRYAS